MLSIVIPTYEQGGKGAWYLALLLESIKTQSTIHKFCVHISDNSDGDDIEKLVLESKLWNFPMVYKRNRIKGASENINAAIDMAVGGMVKIMCQDDLFISPYAIDRFIYQLNHHGWAITNSIHINEEGRRTFKKRARYDHNQFEKNITGMPSVVGFRSNSVRFDTRLKTLCDMYFYYQLYELYGPPAIIRTYNVGQRFWDGSLSRTQPPSHDTDRNLLRTEKKILC